MPRLSVRGFAELLALPAYVQLRLLHDQKYPKSEPQRFRIPFYQPALKGIRSYYGSGNNPAELAAARAKAKAVALEARRNHNLRVIDQFEKSVQSSRQLQPKPSPTSFALVNGVEIRLSFDLVAEEGKTLRRILYNVRNAEIDVETARTTLEIAHWVLEKSGLAVNPKTLEYVDIFAGHARSISKVRSQTVQRVQANAKIIKTLWPTV